MSVAYNNHTVSAIRELFTLNDADPTAVTRMLWLKMVEIVNKTHVSRKKWYILLVIGKFWRKEYSYGMPTSVLHTRS